jgi:hypothetical protein
MEGRKQWSDTEISVLKNSYKSITDLSHELGRTYKSVARKREQLGICRPKLEWDINESFFDVWGESSAYVLGYWFADGNMFFDDINGSYYISYASKDYDLAVSILRTMGSQREPYNNKDGVYRVRFSSKHMYERLLSLGGTPAKSLNVTFPIIPHEMLPHFLRGNLDGDGHISLKKNFYPLAGFTGNFNFLTGLRDSISISSNLRVANKGNLNSYKLEYYGRNAANLLDFLYKDATIYLGRKFIRYIDSQKWVGGQ